MKGHELGFFLLGEISSSFPEIIHLAIFSFSPCLILSTCLHDFMHDMFKSPLLYFSLGAVPMDFSKCALSQLRLSPPKLSWFFDRFSTLCFFMPLQSKPSLSIIPPFHYVFPANARCFKPLNTLTKDRLVMS